MSFVHANLTEANLPLHSNLVKFKYTVHHIVTAEDNPLHSNLVKFKCTAKWN